MFGTVANFVHYRDDGNNAGEGNSTPQGRKHTSTKQSISVRLTPSPSPSPSGSPAVIPRRYLWLHGINRVII